MNVWSFQTKKGCRGEFGTSWKWKKVLQKHIKHSGIRMIACHKHISSFHSAFNVYKNLYCRHINQGFVWKRAIWNVFIIMFSMSFLSHLSTTCSRGAFRITWCPSCVLRHESSTICLSIFSSQTPGPIWTELGRNVPWEVFFKICSQDLIT